MGHLSDNFCPCGPCSPVGQTEATGPPVQRTPTWGCKSIEGPSPAPRDGGRLFYVFSEGHCGSRSPAAARRGEAVPSVLCEIASLSCMLHNALHAHSK